MPRAVYWTVEAHGDDTGYGRHAVGWFQTATAAYSLATATIALVEAQNVRFAHVGAFFISHIAALGFLTLAQFVSLLFYFVSNKKAGPTSRHGYMTDAFGMKFVVAFIATVVQLVFTGWFLLQWLLKFPGTVTSEGDIDLADTLETTQFFQVFVMFAQVSFIGFAAQLLATIAHFYPSRVLHHIISMAGEGGTMPQAAQASMHPYNIKQS